MKLWNQPLSGWAPGSYARTICSTLELTYQGGSWLEPTQNRSYTLFEKNNSKLQPRGIGSRDLKYEVWV